jgi:S-DNA-T family DNA segregation ATPase FtsK/SpoIIIE
VDVITGLIKSNLPARIAFQVASRTDSRVVLDEMGAERLLGNGDMLFLSPGTSQILRGQGTFLSDDEIGRVMAAIGTSEPQYAADLVNLQPAAAAGEGAKAGPSPKDKDDLYEAAVEVVIREGRGSVSLLQRALGVGYGRGARLIDFMAEDGVVGQYAGSQAREVLITMEQWAERNGTPAPVADPAPRRLKIQPHAAMPPAAAAPAAKRPAAAAKPLPAIPAARPAADLDDDEDDGVEDDGVEDDGVEDDGVEDDEHEDDLVDESDDADDAAEVDSAEVDDTDDDASDDDADDDETDDDDGDGADDDDWEAADEDDDADDADDDQDDDEDESEDRRG